MILNRIFQKISLKVNEKNMFMQYFITRGDLLIIVSCSIFFFFAACAFAAQYSLIADHEMVPPFIEEKIKAETNPFDSAKRGMKVQLSDGLWIEDQISVNDVLVLNLFDDATYRASIDRISRNVADTIIVRGRLESFSSGYIIISTTDGHSLVNIRIPEQKLEYIIFYDPETQSHYLLEIDPSKKDIIEEGPPLMPPENPKDGSLPEQPE